MPATAIDSMAARGLAADGYVIGDVVGEGGMGRVYRAEQTALGRTVAVKLLRPELARDPDQVRRFQQEAQAASRLSHPNSIAIIDFGCSASGEPFLVMEYVSGPNLGELVRRDGPLSLARAIAFVDQILSALEAAHAAGVVHADIKSDNILVESSEAGERVKIIDFGLASLRRARHGERIDGDMVSGTPEYIAPEVIRGHVPTSAADIYAVGIVLFELLTGSTPFAGGSPVQVLERHLHEAVVPPSLRRPDVAIPAAVERVVARALAKRVDQRFPDARSFRLALAAAFDPATISVPCERPAGPRLAVAREGATLDFRPTLRDCLVAGMNLRRRGRIPARGFVYARPSRVPSRSLRSHGRRRHLAGRHDHARGRRRRTA